jgi:hypothetical protein
MIIMKGFRIGKTLFDGPSLRGYSPRLRKKSASLYLHLHELHKLVLSILLHSRALAIESRAIELFMNRRPPHLLSISLAIPRKRNEWKALADLTGKYRFSLMASRMANHQ